MPRQKSQFGGRCAVCDVDYTAPIPAKCPTCGGRVAVIDLAQVRAVERRVVPVRAPAAVVHFPRSDPKLVAEVAAHFDDPVEEAVEDIDRALQYKPWRGQMEDIVQRVRDDPEGFAEKLVEWSADKKTLLNTIASMNMLVTLLLERTPETVTVTVCEPAPPVTAIANTVPLREVLDAPTRIWFEALAKARGRDVLAEVAEALEFHIDTAPGYIEDGFETADHPQTLKWAKAYRAYGHAVTAMIELGGLDLVLSEMSEPL